MKNHEIAEVINELRDTAVTYAGTQQLRARIAKIILPLLMPNTGQDRHFCISYTHSVANCFGYGSCTYSSPNYPSINALKEQIQANLVDNGINGRTVIILGVTELTKADYDSWVS